MTIPSRPAPPPPQSVHTQNRQHSSSINQTQSRYGSTNWASFDNNLFDQPTDIVQNKKNPPPPRPPPPKVSSQPFKKPSQPTSVNLLSNLFGKAKLNGTKPSTTHTSNTSRSVTPNEIPKLAAPPSSTVSHDASQELISFDSPPNSPTLTQKSNSDCNSINSSFSSDSNNYIPHNGRTSQPESGFEDDFSFGKDPWDTNDPFSPLPYDVPKSTASYQKPVTIGSTSFYSYDLYGSGSAKSSADFVDPLCNGKSLLSKEPVLTKPTIIKPAITKPKPKLNSSYQNKGPAPSLPSSTTHSSPQQQEEFDENEPSYGIAMYDFDPIQDGDLILRENEKVYLHKKLNDEWYYGKNRRGCEGMFPASYISVKVPIREASSTKNQQSQAMTSSSIQKSQPTARALYSFAAETQEDLSLQENDFITDLQRINDEWLYGRIGSRQGQFPANFVEIITT